MDVYEITASALSAQRLRLDTISGNLANVNSTRKADGSKGAYRRKNIVFAPLEAPVEGKNGGGFKIGPDGKAVLNGSVSNFRGAGVQVLAIQEDTETPMRVIYDPGHPDADEKGYVELPNVSSIVEMVDMISASRAYEANISAMQSAKAMEKATLDM
ncbi:MAG: flagellar basal body rod protein FlgC [Vampirovibrionales bacterium]|nr:flagellar basal body rod protein FlgC [Vampirovibrionales bacterium]